MQLVKIMQQEKGLISPNKGISKEKEEKTAIRLEMAFGITNE